MFDGVGGPLYSLPAMSRFVSAFVVGELPLAQHREEFVVTVLFVRFVDVVIQVVAPSG